MLKKIVDPFRKLFLYFIGEGELKNNKKKTQKGLCPVLSPGTFRIDGKSVCLKVLSVAHSTESYSFLISPTLVLLAQILWDVILVPCR